MAAHHNHTVSEPLNIFRITRFILRCTQICNFFGQMKLIFLPFQSQYLGDTTLQNKRHNKIVICKFISKLAYLRFTILHNFYFVVLVRLGQVRLGQVKLGQVRLGQVRLGQVRLGQVRLGQVTILHNFHFVVLVRLGQVRLG